MPLIAGLVKLVGANSQILLAAWLGTPLCAVSIQVEGPFLMQNCHDAPPWDQMPARLRWAAAELQAELLQNSQRHSAAAMLTNVLSFITSTHAAF